MLAVDTNILVRFFTRDDDHQAARAAAVMLNNEIWVSKTVLLETEWVLSRIYGFESAKVIQILRQLAGTASVSVEEPLVVAQALDWFAAGLDFADALHLASSGKAERFATFDQKLAKRAKNLRTIEVAAI